MLPRNDFIFTIGYDGPVAVVDKQARKRYKSLSAMELAEKGLFRAAYASALWSKNSGEINAVLDIYNKNTNAPPGLDTTPERLFGVFLVDVSRSVSL